MGGALLQVHLLRGHLVILLKIRPLLQTLPCRHRAVSSLPEQQHKLHKSVTLNELNSLRVKTRGHADTCLVGNRQPCTWHTRIRTQAHRHIGVEVTRKELQARLAILRHRFVAHLQARTLSSQQRRDAVLALI